MISLTQSEFLLVELAYSKQTSMIANPRKVIFFGQGTTLLRTNDMSIVAYPNSILTPSGVHPPKSHDATFDPPSPFPSFPFPFSLSFLGGATPKFLGGPNLRTTTDVIQAIYGL